MKRIIGTMLILLVLTASAFAPVATPIPVRRTKGTASITVASVDALHNVRRIADFRCDGTADDVQIQAAIDAMPRIGGKIYLSEGEFSISTKLNVNKPIFIEGACINWLATGISEGYRGTILRPTAGFVDTVMEITATDSGGVAFHFGGLKNIGFLGNLQPQGVQIVKPALYVNNAGSFMVDYCGFFYLPYQYVVDLRGHGTWFLNNSVEESAMALAGVYMASARNWIDKCHFRGNKQDIMIVDSLQWITDCDFMDTGMNQIRCSGGDIFISNCKFDTWNVLSSNYAAIEFQAHTDKNIHIHDSIFDGTNCATTAIWDNDKTAEAIIHDNTFYDMGSNRAIDMDTAVKSLIYGNKSDVHVPEQIVQAYKNTSGGSLAVGDIVIADATGVAYDGSQCTTTTTQGDDKVLGMVLETIADDAHGKILTLGKTTALKVDGTADIAIGDFIGTIGTADYTTGTALFTNASTAVVGSGTTFAAAMVGRKIKNNTNGVWYVVSAVTDATHLTLSGAYAGTTTGQENYTITAAGIGMKASAGSDMAFAIALEAYTTNDSAGVIDALLITPRAIQ